MSGELNAVDVELFGTAPSNDATVIEPDPVRIWHRGRLHVHIPAHHRGGLPIKSHWRPLPQGTAAPANNEPADVLGEERAS